MLEAAKQKGLSSSPQSEPLPPEAAQMFFEQLLSEREAIPHPIPIPIPWPFRLGSRFIIWKQDPTVGYLGRRLVYIPSLVINGPRDARINTKLSNVTPVVRSASGDFIFQATTPEADCAHTFAVARQTLTMYERLNGGHKIPWAWNMGGNTDVITVHPRAGVAANAYYSRNQKALKFFYFTPSGETNPVYTCRSLDVTAHEAGHAILDGLKPGWLGMIGNPPQTGGLHEAFGDLSSVFLALSQLDQVEGFIALAKADLHKKSFIKSLAEQFGMALGRPAGLRNADNNLKLSDVSNEVHAISQVFTGAIYDILADIFAYEQRRQWATKDPAQVLLEVSQKLCKLMLRAYMKAPDVGATYVDVVNKMLQISFNDGEPVIYRNFIRNRFALREVVTLPIQLNMNMMAEIPDDPNYTVVEDVVELGAEITDHPSLQAPQDRSGCCGTMQLPEYTLDFDTLESNLEILSEDGYLIPDEELLSDEIEELRKAFM